MYIFDLAGETVLRIKAKYTKWDASHINRQIVAGKDTLQFYLHLWFLLLTTFKMSKDSIKKEQPYDDKLDAQSVENGALESSFQYSASAEKKLVRKIDLM